MQRLGYAATWKTHCFISGGCRRVDLWGHTNGDGDFVLFDPPLGWPWPVHDCYVRRFELNPAAAVIYVHGSRDVDVDGPAVRTWNSITTVTADLDQHGRAFSIIGAVTNVEPKFLSRMPGFRGVSNAQKKEIDRTFESCRDHIVVATGDGLEYGCFVDLERTPTKFRDTVAIKLKAVPLLNQFVFISRNLKSFRFDE